MCNRYKILIRNESELVFRISDFRMKIGPYENQDVARQILFFGSPDPLVRIKMDFRIWNLVRISSRLFLIGTSLIFFRKSLWFTILSKRLTEQGCQKVPSPPVFGRSVKPILTRPWGLVKYAYQILL